MSGRYLTIEVTKGTNEEVFFGYWDFKRANVTYETAYELTRARTLHHPFHVLTDPARVVSNLGDCTLFDSYRPGFVWEIKDFDGKNILLQDRTLPNSRSMIKLVKVTNNSNECNNVLPFLNGSLEVGARVHDIFRDQMSFQSAGSVQFSKVRNNDLSIDFRLDNNIFSKSYKLRPVNENGLCVFKKRNKAIFSLYKTDDQKIQFSSFADLSKKFRDVDFFIKIK
jgi:hypothetical protein